MKPEVQARVITAHRGCDDARWKFDSRSTREGDIVRQVYADRRGYRNNGGRIFYLLCCVESWRCPASAMVSKGYLHNAALFALGVDDDIPR